MKKGDIIIAKKNGYMDDGRYFCLMGRTYKIKGFMNNYIIIHSEYSTYHRCTRNFFNEYFDTAYLSDELFEI